MGLGFDYHALTDKFDIRRINANFQKLENIGLVNPNLLHDGDWRTPINQRNATGAVSNAYCIDHWIGNGTVTPVSGSYVTLANGTTMTHRMEIIPSKLLSKTVTASIEIGGVIQSATLTFPSSESGSAVNSALTGATVEIGFVDLGSGNTSLLENVASRYIPYYKITATAGINVQRVKLEIGTVSTLAQDAPMDRVRELLICQRYYKQIGNNSSGCSVGVGSIPIPTIIFLTVYLSVTMRIAPTFIYTGTIYSRSAGAELVYCTMTNIITDVKDTNAALLRLTPSFNLAQGACDVFTAAGGILRFNADL